MKYFNYRNAFFILLIFCIFKNCNQKSIVKEIKGHFKTDTIQTIKTVYVPKLKIKTITKTIVDENFTDSLAGEYQVLKDELDFALDRYAYEMDSIQQLNTYADAIALREFSQPFEDDYIRIENKGITSGTIKKLETNYTIKKQPQLKYRILAGGSLGINQELNQGLYKINLGFQNSKSNIIKAEFMKLNQKNYYILGYDFNIFSLKK